MRPLTQGEIRDLWPNFSSPNLCYTPAGTSKDSDWLTTRSQINNVTFFHILSLFSTFNKTTGDSGWPSVRTQKGQSDIYSEAHLQTIVDICRNSDWPNPSWNSGDSYWHRFKFRNPWLVTLPLNVSLGSCWNYNSSERLYAKSDQQSNLLTCHIPVGSRWDLQGLELTLYEAKNHNLLPQNSLPVYSHHRFVSPGRAVIENFTFHALEFCGSFSRGQR